MIHDDKKLWDKFLRRGAIPSHVAEDFYRKISEKNPRNTTTRLALLARSKWAACRIAFLEKFVGGE